MNFTIVEKAGLRMTDLAEIVGVTRGRVTQWKTNPPTTASPNYQALVTAMGIIEKAVLGGKLPLSKMDKANRIRVIEKIKAKLSA